MSNINNDQGVLTYLNAVGGIGASMGASGGRSASSSGDSHSWFKAMADAWGRTMDAQANRITELSDAIGTGGDQPSNMVALTAESLKMGFQSQNAATSINSVAEGLKAVARKE
jgi:hypothetical protein